MKHYTEITLTFRERGDNYRRWTLHWPCNGQTTNRVPFEMHFGDHSGARGELLLGAKHIRSLTGDLLHGQRPALSKPLRDFIVGDTEEIGE